MKTDKPLKYEGPDIIYPDRATLVDGKMIVENYLPDVLRRGLGSVYSFANRLNQNPNFRAVLAGRDGLVFQRVTASGLATRLGLGYVDASVVHGAAIDLAHTISVELGSEAVASRQRIASLGYMAVAESQMIGDNNKELGRLIRGRIIYGYEPEAIKRGIDAVLDDEVPPEIERLVLLQNIVRCGMGTEPAVTEFGGVYVPPNLAVDFDQQRKALDNYRYAPADDRPTYLRDFDRNIIHLEQQLNTVLANTELARKVAGVLIQQDYGPAAWLLCCKDMALDDLTPEIAQGLVTTNTRLLQMRIIALLNAVANGGTFVEIIDDDDGPAARRLRLFDWMPTEVV